MPSRAATQSAANSDLDNDSANAAGGASDTRKRKASGSRAASAKKSAAPRRAKGKAAGANDGEVVQAVLQADRDDSLDVDDDEDDEDDGAGSKAGGGTYSKAKPANRKAQNRNAQRESRQRKAEYVKALEGYVALHKVDQSSQLQGLLFAIGLLIDENMKLRSTLGAISSLFSDPTQGSRLPDVGVDIHGLKEAVERNDKSYLLDLGERLRERIGKQWGEPQAEKVTEENHNKPSGSIQGQLDTARTVGANEEQAPIFGNLTARAEKELLEKIRISGDSFESGGLGMLDTPGSSARSSKNHLESATDENRAPSTTNNAPVTSMDELYRVFQHTTRMEQMSKASSGSQIANAPVSQGVGQGSGNATPIDYNEYLHPGVLNGSADDIMNMDLNQFLFANGPSPPGFQMPDFTSLGMAAMPSYSSQSHHTPYTTASMFSANQTNPLQPPIHYAAPSPAFGMVPAASPSLRKESPAEGSARTAGGSIHISGDPTAPSGVSGTSLVALQQASKTLHKQAKQLIKFHLRSKQEDDAHELPIALVATSAQSIIPHDSRIDGIIWPAIRDRLIFSNGKIDLEVVLQSLESGEAVIVHATGDLLDPTAWELSESFAHAYPGLLDGEILKSCNKWRTARVESPIVL